MANKTILFTAQQSTEFLSGLSDKVRIVHYDVSSVVMVPISLFGMLISLIYLYKRISSCEKPIKRITTSKIPRVSNFYVPLKFVDGMYSLYQLRKCGVKQFELWFEKHGSLFELPFGLGVLTFVGDTSLIKKIVLSTNPHHMNKPHYLTDKLFPDSLQNGLINSDYDVWSHRRRMMSRSFSYTSLQSFLPHVNSYAQSLVQDLLNDGKVIIRKNAVWDVLDKYFVKLVAHFVTGSASCGSNAGSNFYEDFKNYKRIIGKRFLTPYCHIYPLWLVSPIRREYNKQRIKFENYIDNIVGTHMVKFDHADKVITAQPNSDEEEIDYTLENSKQDEWNFPGKTNMFVSLIEELISRNATKTEIREEAATFLVAGYETILTAIQMLLVHLGMNHDEQVQCRREIDAIYQQKYTGISTNLNAAENNSLSMEDLSKLKHLERCILESLRLTSVIPFFTRTLDSPLKLNEELVLKPGTTVAISPWALHRDSKLFPNPRKFDSSRFLSENVKKRDPFSYLPFSGGPRNCIGYKAALLEMKVFAAYILRHFEIDCKDSLEDVKFHFEITIRLKDTFNIALKKRNLN